MPAHKSSKAIGSSSPIPLEEIKSSIQAKRFYAGLYDRR